MGKFGRQKVDFSFELKNSFLIKKYGTFWSKINLVQNRPVTILAKLHWNKKKVLSIFFHYNLSKCKQNKGNKNWIITTFFFYFFSNKWMKRLEHYFSSVCLCNCSVLAVKMCCLNPEKMHQKTKFFTKLSLVVVVEFWEHYNNSM